ncbi:MAG TPA: hypothetical protein VJZ27_00125 [Aggregatilineales bacterium]|nr:hypothetical protein [Aggregatilineales bacterium]
MTTGYKRFLWIVFLILTPMLGSVVFLMSGILILARQTQPGSPGITYAGNHNGDVELFHMRSDGRYIRQVTTNYELPYAPTLSPDGEHLAFVFTFKAPPTIYLAQLDGSQPRHLTTTAGYSIQPAWSPNGEWIAYSASSSGFYELYRIRADGSERQRMTRSFYSEWHPAWSPDGQWIAFESDRSGNREIFVISADSKVEDTSGAALGELRSDDVFATDEMSTLRRSQQEIISGERLTYSPGYDWNPQWSPDGRWIAFVSDRDGNPEIYRMRVDGSDITRLTHDPGKDQMPAWSPDGRWIAFISDRSGTWDIYRMSVDGSHLERMTNDEFANLAPVWSPIVDLPLHPFWLSGVALMLMVIPALVTLRFWT